MTMSTKVSVIIPTYNSAQYIKEALNSVFSQTYKNIEVIVIDDGSTDNTKQVLDEFLLSKGFRIENKENGCHYTLNAKPYTLISYFYQENKGPASARNRGIQEARGEYIAFLDADDLWLPEKLEKQLKLFKMDQRLKFVYCGEYLVRPGEDGTRCEVKLEKSLQKGRGQQFLLKNCVGSASVVVANRECFCNVGLFDESLKVAEDWDMWLRIYRKFPFGYIKEPLVKIRAHKGSQSYYADKNLVNELRFLKKTFSENGLNKKLFLKAKSYSYRYFCAAGVLLTEGYKKKAIYCILKSLLFDPIHFFSNKESIGLFLRVVLGKKFFDSINISLKRIGINT